MTLGLDANQIKERAREIGFELAGVSPAGPFPELDSYDEWLERGYAGEMHYLARRQAERHDPSLLLDGIRTVVVCALNYHSTEPLTAHDPDRAWISRYAWSEDYHSILKVKLDELAEWIRDRSGGRTRTYVDTGPLVERVYARYAGVGWFGKNTCIINQGIGSWTFLGCILTDLDLAPDTPAPDRCGSCTRCIDACPTRAILDAGVLDSRRCISYLTIELRGAIPEDLRGGIGHHLFGCDICQDVCPWNRRAPRGEEASLAARPELVWPRLEPLLDLDEDGWRRLIRGTAMKRARVAGLMRNLMVVAGNSGVSRLAGKLEKFLNHSDEIVRSHARWALEKLRGAVG